MNMPLTIVHTEASCGWGGQEIRILEESRAMLALGHAVAIICPAHSKIYEAAQQRGIEVHALGIDQRTLPVIWRARGLLKRLKPSVVNTHSSADSWVIALARLCLKPRVPVVRTRHISAPVSRSFTTRWLYGKGADHVVTTGESLKQDLVQRLNLPASHFTSVPTGIDPARFMPRDKSQVRTQLGLAPETPVVGIVATLRSWKGHLDLLDAWAQVLKQHPQWVLVIAGDGPMREQIEDKAEALHIAAHVRVVGQQSNPELWLSAMDVFCLPSYANEGVPQAILQAMMTGLPVVSTPVGAIAEAVIDGETGQLVPPRNVDAIAQALCAQISNPALRDGFGQAARARAQQRFSFVAMQTEMARIFNQTVSCR